MTHLTTYADTSMSLAAQICAASAKANGIDKVWSWTDAAIRQTEFYEQNKAILDQPRGSGYWLWKPFIILDTLQRMKEGEILVYADAGVEFVAPVQHIIDRMTDDIWLFGNMYQHVHWCKADVFGMTGIQYPHKDKKQVQASVIVIKNTTYSRSFIYRWLEFCQRPGMIDDTPSGFLDHPEFREHRHDQAIITTLAYQENMFNLHWWPAMYNCGAFTYEKGGYTDNYPVLFHHHRCRNNEIQQPGMFRDYFHKKYPQIV